MHTEMSNARSGCSRRWRREAGLHDMTPAGLWPDFHASYIGSTNVELRWDTTAITTSCYESFFIQWRKLEEANETVVHYDKTVTDYLVEIDDLESNTIYTFTLNGRINGEDKELKNANYSTLDGGLPSLIVTSVTNSSLSVKWEALDNFVVSLSGHADYVTNGTNYTFENLQPGSIYKLKLLDTSTDNFTEREVVTIPEPVYVDANVSDTTIDFNWMGNATVEVMYIGQQPKVCQLRRLSGTSGNISGLSYGCMYQLDVFAVSGGRRSGSSQTIHREIDAKESEKFECKAGKGEGQIICDLEQRPPNSCFMYQWNLSQPDTNSKTASNQITVNNLTPGLTYSISLWSITETGNSTSAQTTNATARTGIDATFFEKSSKYTKNSIRVDYLVDEKRVIEYYNVTTNGTSYILNDSSTWASLNDLEAGYCHMFTAYAVSQDIDSRIIRRDICTVPYPPPSIKCINVTNHSLVLSIWKPNAGHVDQYEITTTEGGRTSHFTELANAATVNASILQLRIYTDYEIKVKSAVNKISLRGTVESEETLPITCKTAEGIPGRVRFFQNTTYGMHSVGLTWHKPSAENGVLTGYIITIYQPDGSIKTVDVGGDRLSYELSDPNVYAGNTYKISISAKTSIGEGQAESINVTLKEKDSQALFIILALLLAILFTVLIALLVFYYIRKSPERMMSLRRGSHRLRHLTDQMQMFPQPSYTSKPIKLSEFLECLKLLERDSGLKFTEEYEDLKFVGRNQSRDEAELQCNRVKNRFTNILPYDISRVKLLPMEDEDGSDYINANWIPGFHSKREFIATQGPLPSTINDFWRMVWENNCQAIVMLTQCIEKGHIKCEQYWPFDTEPVFYGDLKVEIQNETKTQEWNIVEFKISLGAQTRKLKHFHYVGWPDMYVPEKTSLLAFVHIVRESVNTSNSKGSVVVHCSAGVGRTGTFIALDTLLLHIQDSHDLDVYGIVFQMRMNRVLMVQTEAQYVFIYECLNQVLVGPTDQVEKIKEADTNGDVKTEASQEEQKTKELESKPNSDSKEVQDKKESESKSNRNSKEVQEKKESELKSIHDSKEKQNEKDLDSKSNRNSSEEQNKKESESKHSSDSKDGPTKTEIELKPIANSKEEPNKKELEPNSDSNEKKITDDTANNPDPEPAKETAKNEADTNK